MVKLGVYFSPVLVVSFSRELEEQQLVALSSGTPGSILEVVLWVAKVASKKQNNLNQYIRRTIHNNHVTHNIILNFFVNCGWRLISFVLLRWLLGRGRCLIGSRLHCLWSWREAWSIGQLRLGLGRTHEIVNVYHTSLK